MNMLTILLFIITYVLYWAVKGILIKKAVPAVILFAVTIALWYALYSLNLGINGTMHWIILGYLAVSLVFQIFFVSGLSPFEKCIFSGVYVKAKEVTVKYFWLKPITWLLVNILLIIKRCPIIGFGDTVEVDVVSRDRVSVMVRL